MRIIGDIHQKYEQFQHLVWNVPHSIQIGDMGFNYEFLNNNLDPHDHVFIPGNHENYNNLPVHSLGDYGYRDFHGTKFFFVRGAFSIDYKHRTPLIDWFPNEQLSYRECENCLESYKGTELMLTHDCPRFISNIIGNAGVLINFGFSPTKFTTVTSELLEQLWYKSKPKLWIFGHYHRSFDEVIDGCRFVCLPELGYIDI